MISMKWSRFEQKAIICRCDVIIAQYQQLFVGQQPIKMEIV